VRVLFLSQIVPYPPHGGVLQRGYNLVRELGRRATVDLLAYVHPDVLATPTAIEDSQRALREFCATVEYFSLWPKTSRFHRVAALAAGTVSTEPFSVIAHRSQAFGRRVAEEVQRNTPDVIHVDTIALAPFVPPGHSVPAALTHHNIESVLMARRAEVEQGALARAYLRREAAKLRAFEAAVSPAFDINIVMSEQDATVLADICPGVRSAVVPNGVDIEYFTPRPEQETPALIYGGGMNMFANRDAVMFFLNEVWPGVRERVADAKFFAVGQDPPPELLACAARDARVVVTGYVPGIRPYIWQSAVYVVPLRVGGGTRLKVLDAMAMGKALVSTSIGCEGIEVTPGEHLIVADGAAALTEATVALLFDRERRVRLGRAARALVEAKYAWRVVADSLMDAYRRAGVRGRPAHDHPVVRPEASEVRR
jgi:glycosyltransferase involved in cell wall biosynthesis